MRGFIISLALLFSGLAGAQSDFDVVEAGIAELQQALNAGDVSSVELVDRYLERIAAYDQQGPALNSIIRINPDARQRAAALDEERRRSGPRGPLHGIPILVKDNYNTTHMPTSNGTVALAGFIPNANATQIDKLLDAGVIILAKTTLHEYARGITTISSLSGQTLNPYDIRRVPGGSSGGTGAAVAASFGAAGLGSDTCGSIRIPSAFNNLFGLRPSKGLSSIHGVVPLSHTQDVAGPLARSLDDLAIVLDTVVGYDPNDEATAVMRSRPHPQFRRNLATIAAAELRLGKLTSAFDDTGDGVLGPVEQALAWYEEQGARLIDVEIPGLGELLAGSALIGHEFRVDFEGYLRQFGSTEITDLQAIVENGLYHLSLEQSMSRSLETEFDEEAYAAAVARRKDVSAAIERVFLDHDLDAIVYPTVIRSQVFAGEPQPGSQCRLAAHSGHPALSMPVGFSDRGLPVGMELLGMPFQDARLLAIAYPYEQATAPRQAPPTTPPLHNGVPPPARFINVDFNQQGAQLQASFAVDVTTNLLQYDVVLAAGNRAGIHAVTLLIDDDEEEGLELNAPVALNLMGPGRRQASGRHFMSAELRRAFAGGRVYLKVFGDSLPDSGAPRLLQ